VTIQLAASRRKRAKTLQRLRKSDRLAKLKNSGEIAFDLEFEFFADRYNDRPESLNLSAVNLSKVWDGSDCLPRMKEKTPSCLELLWPA
jgi:hypothetical protein